MPPSPQPGDRPRISAVVVARNEAAKLPDCLASLQGADELILIDDLSTDATPELAAQAGARVITQGHEGENWDLLKNLGLEAATGDWVLLVDADERVPPEAWQALRALLDHDPPWALAWLPRQERYFGAWAQHAHSDARVLRLARRGAVRFAGDRLHAHPEVLLGGQWTPFERLPAAAVGFVAAPLAHEAYATVAEYLTKTLRYTEHEAQWRFAAGERVRRKRDVWLPAARYFWYRYSKLKGHRDGLHGLVVCLAVALYPLLQQLRLWELGRQEG